MPMHAVPFTSPLPPSHYTYTHTVCNHYIHTHTVCNQRAQASRRHTFVSCAAPTHSASPSPFPAACAHIHMHTHHHRLLQGSNAGMPVKVFVTLKDSRGRRVKEGGDEVTVRVQQLGLPAPGAAVPYIDVTVADNNDGSYAAVYSAPAKGNYSLTVEVNGLPIAGSPFPVFFSAPLDPAQLAAIQQQEAEAARAQQAAREGSVPPGGAPGASTGASAAAPAPDEHLRTLYVSNISPSVPLDRVKEFFSIFGPILEFNVVGERNDMAVVIFANKEAQQQGQQLNNTQVRRRLGCYCTRVARPLAAERPKTRCSGRLECSRCLCFPHPHHHPSHYHPVVESIRRLLLSMLAPPFLLSSVC